MITGIQQIVDNGMCENTKIGLLTNQTGILASGEPNWKALKRTGAHIKVLFGPEHGFTGEAQDVVPVDDAAIHGIPIYSLFGRHLSPTLEMLANIEMMVIDIQDIGCRYYTYIYTISHMMKACEQYNIRLLIADRPNPLGMFGIRGNQLDDRFSSFVGAYNLPVQHGLTIGEFALYLKRDYFPQVSCEIVPMKEYSKEMQWHSFSLPWVAPSPNIPCVETTYVYPGTCLFEGTNVSEGRGTTKPFEIIGAPWIDGELLRETLLSYDLPGVVFTSQFFTPTFSKYRGESCQGITLHVTDNTTFLPFETGIALLHAIIKLYPKEFSWKEDWEEKGSYFIHKLLGSPKVISMLDAHEPYLELLQEVGSVGIGYADMLQHIQLYAP